MPSAIIKVRHPLFEDVPLSVKAGWNEFQDFEGGAEPYLQRQFTTHEITDFYFAGNHDAAYDDLIESLNRRGQKNRSEAEEVLLVLMKLPTQYKTSFLNSLVGDCQSSDSVDEQIASHYVTK